MNTLFKFLIALSVSMSVFAFVVVMNANKGGFGSVGVSGEYLSTSTRNAFNGTTAIANGQLIVSGAGTLGSVVITGAAAGTVNFYDATSTVTNSQFPTTTIASIPVSAAAGTYTFDVTFKRGLVYEIIGTAPTSTITYRR